jgi:hypothetical protein
MGRITARLLVVALLVGSMLTGTGLMGTCLAEETEKEEGYVRDVESSTSLADTERGPGWSYNPDYLFAISKAVRDSSVHPAGKVFLFIPAIPLDIVLSPFAAIAGLFGD